MTTFRAVSDNLRAHRAALLATAAIALAGLSASVPPALAQARVTGRAQPATSAPRQIPGQTAGSQDAAARAAQAASDGDYGLEEVRPAQARVASSQPVVQAVPGSQSQPLNAALSRLARNPRDGEALIDAGKAATAMGDTDAAIGFYNRAAEVLPGNPRIKAGLATAYVRSENPFDAIPLFAEAEQGGIVDPAVVADRGLAYDLVGDNGTAQRYYQQALTATQSDEVRRRLALSQAIGGDKAGAEATLAPLLARRDRASYRTRAFALAIAGQTEEAVSIAYASLPQDLAAAISPYLRYMPRLTPSQQAAAANFGHFPRAADVGRDDPRVAAFAPPGGRRASVASADTALVPAGQPLGKRSRTSRRGSDGETALSAPRPDDTRRAAQTRPAREPALAARSPASATPPAASLPPPPLNVGRKMAEAEPLVLPATPPAIARSQPASTETAAPGPAVAIDLPAPKPAALPASPPTTMPPAVATPVVATPPPSAAPVLAANPPAPAAAPRQEPVATPVVQRPPAPSLADAFSDLAPSRVDTSPAPGAVDIRRIAPTRPAAKKDDPKKAEPAKPAPPAHPSRIWVQVATGRDKNALAFDWRRLVRQAPEAFRGKSGNVSDWGQTRRLLAGPFQTQAAANAFLQQLRKEKVDGAFLWTSPAGQVVDTL